MDAKTASKKFSALKGKMGVKDSKPGSLLTAKNAGLPFNKAKTVVKTAAKKAKVAVKEAASKAKTVVKTASAKAVVKAKSK